MNPIPVSIPIIMFIVGFWFGTRFVKKIKGSTPQKKVEKLKVFHKSEPKTYQERRVEAIDNNKPLIKTFYK